MKTPQNPRLKYYITLITVSFAFFAAYAAITEHQYNQRNTKTQQTQTQQPTPATCQRGEIIQKTNTVILEKYTCDNGKTFIATHHYKIDGLSNPQMP